MANTTFAIFHEKNHVPSSVIKVYILNCNPTYCIDPCNIVVCYGRHALEGFCSLLMHSCNSE